jgi:hypothetical protein
MGEYDAFGRKKDEAGLGDLGWGTSDDPSAPSGPQRTVSTTADESGLSSPAEFKSVPTGPPPPVRRRGRSPIAILIQFAVLAGIAFAIYAAVDAGNDAANKVRDAFNGIGGSNGSGGDQGDDTVPDQVEARKLFTPAGLRDALKVMEREVPGKLTGLSIRRDRINATVTKDGKQAVVDFQADAEVPQIFSTSAASPGVDALSYEQINPTAPSRLMRAANQRLGKSEADVDYFVPSIFAGDVQWGIYYKGGSPIALGDSRGRYQRRIS